MSILVRRSLSRCVRAYSDQRRTFCPSRFVRARAFIPKQKNAGSRMNTRAMIGRYVIIFDTSFSLAVAHGSRWRGGGLQYTDWAHFGLQLPSHLY